MISKLPTAARRACALRSAYHSLGFPPDTVFIVSTDQLLMQGPVATRPHQAPDGQAFLVVALALEGNAAQPHHSMCAGTVDRSWWDAAGADETMVAWNELSQPDRHAEFQSWISPIVLQVLVEQLQLRGITPPVVGAQPGNPGKAA